MGKARKYRVDFERDPKSGEWTAVIDRSQGVSCVTQGRSISIARKRIREALALFLNDKEAAARAELVENYALPVGAKGVLERAIEVRTTLRELEREAKALSERAAKR